MGSYQEVDSVISPKIPHPDRVELRPKISIVRAETLSKVQRVTKQVKVVPIVAIRSTSSFIKSGEIMMKKTKHRIGHSSGMI